MDGDPLNGIASRKQLYCTKRGNFCDFLFASLDGDPFLKLHHFIHSAL